MKHRRASRVSPAELDALRHYGVTITADDFAEGHGVERLTTRGTLKMMVIVDVNTYRPEFRAGMRRVQDHARALCDAEMVKARPRDAGDTLYAAFCGERLDTVLATPETSPNGHLEAMLDILGEVCDRLDAERGPTRPGAWVRRTSLTKRGSR
jgi:hypothetical protein